MYEDKEKNDSSKKTQILNIPNDGSKNFKLSSRPAQGGNQMTFIILSEKEKKNKPTGIRLTKEEVSKHSTEDDAWIIYKDKVYDITLYLKYHPGGKDILLQEAGKDVTALVLQQHPWVNVESILKNCYIGDVED